MTTGSRLARITITAALGIGLSACGGGIDESAGTSSAPSRQPQGERGTDLVIRYTTQHTENTPYSRATARWADRVREKTNGRISVEINYSASLLPANESLTGIADGRADAGFVVDTMFANQLPLTTSSSIPFDRTNGVAQAKAFHELYQDNKDYQAEFERLGLHVLMFQPPGATVIGSSKEINSLEGLSGLSIRCLGYICDSLKAVGAKPVALASNDIYEAMDRKTINGWAAYPFMDMVATQFQEVTPFVTDPGMGTYIQAFTPINKRTWDSIGPEDQKALTDLADEYYDTMAEEMNKLERETCSATRKEKVKLGTLPKEATTRWRTRARDAAYQKWLADAAKATTTDPAKFYRDFMSEYTEQVRETKFTTLYGACAEGKL